MTSTISLAGFDVSPLWIAIAAALVAAMTIAALMRSRRAKRSTVREMRRSDSKQLKKEHPEGVVMATAYALFVDAQTACRPKFARLNALEESIAHDEGQIERIGRRERLHREKSDKRLAGLRLKHAEALRACGDQKPPEMKYRHASAWSWLLLAGDLFVVKSLIQVAGHSTSITMSTSVALSGRRSARSCEVEGQARTRVGLAKCWKPVPSQERQSNECQIYNCRPAKPKRVRNRQPHCGRSHDWLSQRTQAARSVWIVPVGAGCPQSDRRRRVQGRDPGHPCKDQAPSRGLGLSVSQRPDHRHSCERYCGGKGHRYERPGPSGPRVTNCICATTRPTTTTIWRSDVLPNPKWPPPLGNSRPCGRQADRKSSPSFSHEGSCATRP